jgi:hypothetical protein
MANDTVKEVEVFHGPLAVGVRCHPAQTVAVAREPTALGIARRPVILGLQDGNFLPEGSLDLERDHTAARGGEKSWGLLGDPRCDSVVSDGPLIRE